MLCILLHSYNVFYHNSRSYLRQPITDNYVSPNMSRKSLRGGSAQSDEHLPTFNLMSKVLLCLNGLVMLDIVNETGNGYDDNDHKIMQCSVVNKVEVMPFDHSSC